MANEKIAQEIVSLVARTVKLPESKITLPANLFNDLGVDSLSGLELFAALDKRYGLDIPEDKLRSIVTVGDLVSLVESLLPKK